MTFQRNAFQMSFAMALEIEFSRLLIDLKMLSMHNSMICFQTRLDLFLEEYSVNKFVRYFDMNFGGNALQMSTLFADNTLWGKHP